MPVSPSMEAVLSTSQDSLTSTGSNQELKTQLDSTLKEVEAIAEHLEKQKKPPLEKANSESMPKPMVRRKTSEQLVSKTLPSSNGARPRERVSLSTVPDPAPRPSVSVAPSGMLRQSSWASREQVNEIKSKNVWEKQSSSDVGSLRGGFRSNRDFWNQRVSIQQKAKQTPDLVLDLPASSPGSLKPKPRPRGLDSMSSSSGSGDENLTGGVSAEQFAKPDRNTLKKANSNSSSPPEEKKRIPPVQARLLKKSPPE